MKLKEGIELQQQNQQQNMQGTNQMMSSQTSFGGNELFHAQESIGCVIDAMDQYLLFEQHIQDQELTSILQRHRSFLTQLYNTIVDTLKTGQDPAVPTQTYHMEQNNEVIYGMQPSAPKSPSQSVNEINDECISSFMLDALKSISSSFTTSALEATNPVLRRIISDSIPNVIEMAYEVFLYQNKHQYYQVLQLPQQDMQAISNGFAPIQSNMPH